MGMKKGQKQYGRMFTERIFALKAEGLTHRQIAVELGIEYVVIKKAVERENKRQRKANAGEIPKFRRGRPRVKPMTTLEELQKRNKELEMENELLKKFHEELRR